MKRKHLTPLVFLLIHLLCLLPAFAASTEIDCANPPASNETITLMVLYPRSLAGQATAVNNYANAAIADTNAIFTASGIKITYQLVHVGMITGEQPSGPRTPDPYNESDPYVAQPILQWLSDQFEQETPTVDTEVELLRKAYGADQIVVVIPEHENLNRGVANEPRKLGGNEVLHDSVEPFAGQAFAVVELECASTWPTCQMDDHTFAHELGHTFGMRHRSQGLLHALYPWALGHLVRNAAGNAYRATLMECLPGAGGDGYCSRIPRFSNPDLPYLEGGIWYETGVHTNVATKTSPDSHQACVANLRAAAYAGYENAPLSDPPSLAITSPGQGAAVAVAATLTATASDDPDGDLSSSVSWSSDREGFLGTGASIAVGFTLDGSHRITASVTDGSGTRIVKSIDIVVDSVAPLAWIDSPTNAQTIGGSFEIVGWAIDESGIGNLGFRLDGSPVILTGVVYGTARPDVCSAHPTLGDPGCPNVGFRGFLDTTAISNGTHTLTVDAYDAAGNSTSMSRTFSSSNNSVQPFLPTADAWVDQAQPTTNHGADPQLHLRASGSSLARHAYLKFAVAGVTRPVVSAVLQLRTGSVAWDSLNVYRLATTSWAEGSIDWTNAPLDPLGNLSRGAQPANSTVTIDVTSLIAGNGTYTLGLVTSDNPGHFFYGREAASPYWPMLIVTY